VIPYFGYARQDRKVGAAHADLGQAGRQSDHRSRRHRVLTVDLHAGQIQGFFDIPTDNLFAMPVMVKDIKDALGTRRI
jgi:ribose-phosphate pyrophosphokinase